MEQTWRVRQVVEEGSNGEGHTSVPSTPHLWSIWNGTTWSVLGFEQWNRGGNSKACGAYWGQTRVRWRAGMAGATTDQSQQPDRRDILEIFAFSPCSSGRSFEATSSCREMLCTNMRARNLKYRLTSSWILLSMGNYYFSVSIIKPGPLEESVN
jgi:hypothetical protein